MEKSLFVLVLCLVSSSAQFTINIDSTLKEANRSLACPNELVIYICNTTGPLLTWIVEPYILESNAPSFFAGDTPGTSFLERPEANRFLESTSPTLDSALILRPSDGLQNTTVICRTVGASEILPYELSVQPQPPPSVNSIPSEIITMSGFAIHVTWVESGDKDISHYLVDAIFIYVNNTEKRITDSEEGIINIDTFRVFEFNQSQLVNVRNITIRVYTVNLCMQRSAESANTTVPVPAVPTLPESSSASVPVIAGSSVAVFIFLLGVMAGVFLPISCCVVVYRRRKDRHSVTDSVRKKFGMIPQADGSGDIPLSDTSTEDDVIPLIKSVEMVDVEDDGTASIKIEYDEDAVKYVAAFKLKEKRKCQGNKVAPDKRSDGDSKKDTPTEGSRGGSKKSFTSNT